MLEQAEFFQYLLISQKPGILKVTHLEDHTSDNPLVA
jgi:hypothetical protein